MQQYSRSSSNRSLNNLLNAIDSPGVWSQAPVANVSRQPLRPINKPASRAPQGLTAQNLLSLFLGGNTTQVNSATRSSACNAAESSGTAYSNYQQAANEASTARDALARTMGGDDQWCRKNAATQAMYAANNANYAAERAESAAACGNSEARGYANMARDAANEA
ncbi:MAG: hypothetical protein K2X81_16430, partial [Candidatus Obscuribacterales bacterium]|nr:hypothetical protein [Candidatus Obscuribacterales bacterium]